MVRHRFLSLAAAACAGLLIVAVDDGTERAAAQAPAADPAALSAQLIANDAALRTAVVSWKMLGDPPATPPPPELVASAGFVQDAARLLAARPGPARTTLASLPGPLRATINDLTIAARNLRRLHGPGPPTKFRLGQPLPLAELVGHYRAAEGAYGINRHHLAAVNLTETIFGRIKSNSSAGAQGPMQFIPSTWKIYGRGGNIRNPAHAIPAAARLLRDNGAPGNIRRALHAYNPSGLYVDTVLRYASVMARDPDAIHFLYCWHP